LAPLNFRYDDSNVVGNMVNGNANNLNVLVCLSNLHNARPEKSFLPHPDLVCSLILSNISGR
jgi:hypothetical protein